MPRPDTTDATIAEWRSKGIGIIEGPRRGEIADVPTKPGKRSRVRESLPWPAVVPMPPSTNNLFLNGRGKARIKSPEYRAWIASVVPLLRRWVRPLAYPVCIQLKICGEIPANSDIDNRIKSVLDAMVTAGVIHKDNRKHVDELVIKYLGDGVGMAITVVERT